MATGTVIKFLGIDVDETEPPREIVSLLVDEVARVEAIEIAPQTPLCLGLGCNVSVHVLGEALSPGRHEIVIGRVRLPVRDCIEG